MAVNVAEFISVLRKIRDVIYPEVNNLYGNATALNSSITANKNDFDAKYAEFNTDFAEFNQDITTVEGLVLSAQSSATSASQSATTATQKSNEIKAITAQSTTLPAGSQATASYNPVDGKITIGVPSGVKGDKGDSFTVNAVGITSERSLYNTQPTGFSFLDITLALIYFKLSSASGNWSTGSPFGKGDKGDPGAAGNGISGIVFVSTTHPSGLPSQSGGNDTYRITYTNATTFDFVVHNGADLTLSSNLPQANGTASAGTSTQGSKSDHIHPLQTSVSGNAGTATKLTTPRAIGGVAFDGSADISLPGVNISGNQNTSGNAATSTKSTKASTLAQNGADGAPMTFNWSGQPSQPNWLWGGTDGVNMYVYNPNNFSVNYANTAGNAIGYNQSWQNQTSNRLSGVEYTNSTGRAIVVSISSNNWSDGMVSIAVDGMLVAYNAGHSQYGHDAFASAIIPNGSKYIINCPSIKQWAELR